MSSNSQLTTFAKVTFVVKGEQTVAVIEGKEHFMTIGGQSSNQRDSEELTAVVLNLLDVIDTTSDGNGVELNVVGLLSQG